VSTSGKPSRHWLDFGGFYQAQPPWARKLYWFATIPMFLLWGWFIISGAIQTHAHLALGSFGILFVLAAIHNFYFVKALLGGER
jgi:hypothetical protein